MHSQRSQGGFRSPVFRQMSSADAAFSAYRLTKEICSFAKRWRGMTVPRLQGSGCPESSRSKPTGLLRQDVSAGAGDPATGPGRRGGHGSDGPGRLARTFRGRPRDCGAPENESATLTLIPARVQEPDPPDGMAWHRCRTSLYGTTSSPQEQADASEASNLSLDALSGQDLGQPDDAPRRDEIARIEDEAALP